MVHTIDLSKPQAVGYCIPLWLRDEQIKSSQIRVKGRIQPLDQVPNEPVAIVGYGPSLRDTWEKIKDFKYIISCSGAHSFLIERGIVPNWHVAVDPLPGHTVRLIGQPHKDVEYLISSTCNPDVFEHLDGYNVKLWHVFDNSEDGQRLIPAGEWALTGGCDVGLRSLAIAAFLGFKDVHIFGLDGCARGEDAVRHAGDHPSKKQKYTEMEFNGKRYWTTPAMAEAAREIVHEMKQIPKVKCTFYGEGLTQDIAKTYVAPEKEELHHNLVGFTKPELISEEYQLLNKKLHETNLAYGVGGGKHADTILKLSVSLKTTSILDYGCGKGYLAKALPFPIWEYDPGVPGKESPPRAADIVVCTDVLEHIEPDKLMFVLDDLRRCMKKVGFFVIHTGPSMKTLADGRNAHLIQQNKEWWENQFKEFFVIGKTYMVGLELYAVVGPKNKKKKK